MKSRLLFLDIDGVLNNRKSMADPYTAFEDHRRGYPSRLDLDCVKRMNRLARLADCDVVLSSVWRLSYPWEMTNRYFQQVCGCEFDLIGSTDRSWKSHARGQEIEKWRQDHQDFRPFGILDDGCDMKPHMDRLVQTKHKPGLRGKDVKRTLRLFGLNT